MARKRERLEIPGQKDRYIRRNDKGQFTTDQVDVGRSQAADNNQKAKADNKGGQGDKGDQKKR